MVFRNWLTKNVNKTAETVIAQTKETMESKVVKKGNAAFTVGKLVLLGVIFLVAGKEAMSHDTPSLFSSQQDKIPNIVINNYLNERSKENG